MCMFRIGRNLVAGALGFGLFAGSSQFALAGSPETQAFRVHLGTNPEQLFGWSVANVGDINQDGLDDYVIGSPGHGWFSGAAFVHSGQDGSLIHEFHGASFSFFGWSVAGAGDVNADGVPDIIVGAPFHFGQNGPAGQVRVFSGSTGNTLYVRNGTHGAEALGFSVAGLGDVDADGYGDFVAGAPNYDLMPNDNRGRIVVFSGVDGAEILSRSHISGASLGISVAGIGDVTGDGNAEVLAGAPGANHALVIDVYWGAVVRTHSGSSGGFGWSVANAGDVTGDSVDDYLVGVPSGGVGGRATLFNGSSGGVLRNFHAEGAGDGAGFAVASAGDFNGNGASDVLVGVPWQDDGGPNSGRVEVRDVTNGALTRVYYGYPGYTHFASAVAGLGDIDDDGLNDILVGAPLAGGSNRGRAFVFAGATNGGVIISEPGSGGSEYNVAGNPPAHLLAVDLNQDGRADVIMISPTTGRLSWRYALPDGSLGMTFQQLAGNKPTSVAAGDFDGDGDLDLAITLFGEDRVLFMRNPGFGLFSPSGKIVVGKKPVSVAAGDLNKDGRVDLAVACQGANTVLVLRQNATSQGNLANRFQNVGTHRVNTTPVQVSIAKFGTDSWPDIAVMNHNSGNLSLLRNLKQFRFTKQRVFSLGSKPVAMTTADFNKDGLLDIAYVRKNISRVSIRYGQGLSFGPAQHFDFPGGPRALAAVDLNMDGWRDLVAANASDASVVLLLNTCDGSFAAPEFVTAPGGLKFVSAGDVDRDGDPDVIVAGSAISVLTNEWY